MKKIVFLLAAATCFAADRAPDSVRADYWKLRAQIAEANAAFAGSLTSEQKRMLEVIREKSTELQKVRESMSDTCKTPSADQSGEPVCSTDQHTPK